MVSQTGVVMKRKHDGISAESYPPHSAGMSATTFNASLLSRSHDHDSSCKTRSKAGVGSCLRIRHTDERKSI